MKTLLLFVLASGTSISAHANEENTHYSKVSSQPLKIESRTTEPTPLPDPEPEETPDPIDQPPVLDYAKPAPKEPTNRAPATATPQKFVDAELGIACYYLLPASTPGVASPGAPAISCVKLPEKRTTAASPAAPVPLDN